MTYPRRHLAEDEEIIAEKGLHILKVLPNLLTVAMIFAGLGAGFLLWKSAPSWFGLTLGVIFAATLTYLFLMIMSYRSIQLVITNQRVIYRAGIFHRTSRDIPIAVIADVEVTQRLFERLIGIGTIAITTNGIAGTSIFHDVQQPRVLAAHIFGAREQANQHHVREDVVAVEAIDLTEEAIRLTGLRRKGVITQQEFVSRAHDLGISNEILYAADSPDDSESENT